MSLAPAGLSLIIRLAPHGCWCVRHSHLRLPHHCRPTGCPQIVLSLELTETRKAHMELPLTREAFRHALSQGYGRAILHLKQYPDRVYREEIEYAATHCLSYDSQVEGYRTDYLLMVLHSTGDMPSYITPILNQLKTSTEYKDVALTLELAAFFARTGLDQARIAIYDKLERNDTDEAFQPLHTIIGLDGLAGFQRAAHVMGRSILRAPEANTSTWLEVWESDALNLSAATKWVDDECQHSPEIRAFRAVLNPITEAPVRTSLMKNFKTMPYKELIELIRRHVEKAKLGPYPLSKWGQHASEGDLGLFARDFDHEVDSGVLKQMVPAFWKVPFPGSPTKLLQLVNSEDKQLRHYALNALSQVRHESVRQLFFALVDQGQPRFDLLESNFEPGDNEVINRLLKHQSHTTRWKMDDDLIHSIGHDLIQLCESEIVSDWTIVLPWVYEHSRCSNCRRRVITLMIKCKAIPDRMLLECRFDCDSYTRAAATRELAERGWTFEKTWPWNPHGVDAI